MKQKKHSTEQKQAKEKQLNSVTNCPKPVLTVKMFVSSAQNKIELKTKQNKTNTPKKRSK